MKCCAMRHASGILRQQPCPAKHTQMTCCSTALEVQPHLGIFCDSQLWEQFMLKMKKPCGIQLRVYAAQKIRRGFWFSHFGQKQLGVISDKPSSWHCSPKWTWLK